MPPTATERLSHCVMCAGETHPGLTDLRYEFGNVTIVVQSVPADICAGCGEAFIDGPLGVMLGDAVAELAEALHRLVEKQGTFSGGTFQTQVAVGKLVPASD